MGKNIIFFRENFIKKNNIHLSKDEITHLRSLRLFGIEKSIEVRNGRGISYFYRVKAGEIQGEFIDEKHFAISKNCIEIATAIPKAGKFEFLLQKGTELGITRFHFLKFMQSERKDINSERTLKIIKESCSQSKRHIIPEFFIYSSVANFIEKNHLKLYYLDPDSKTNLNSEVFKETAMPIIGPEGGLHKKEIELFKKKSIPGYKIGDEILRIETAGLYITGLIKFFEMVKNV